MDVSCCTGWLVNSYSETHSRGLPNSGQIMEALCRLVEESGAVAKLAVLSKAALAQDGRRTLDGALCRLDEQQHDAGAAIRVELAA